MSSVLSTTSMAATASAASPSSTKHRATPQGGILDGSNPSVYNPKDPIIMFIIQAGIIIIFCRLLHYPLSKIRQPRVIAEVIGGILLGPSVMGRIPGFTAHIFPSGAQPTLATVANVGLILFLFLVGLEVDVRFLISNWRIALSVGFLGMVIPFGLGCAIAWGLYNEFKNEPGTVQISFGVFMLFIGVAMAITAFPVLCRILTELKLLQTPVGVIVLSAGVGNDVVGWILLALCVALVNAGTGLTALWVLLTAVGYALFLVYAVRPAFIWILRRSRALQDGPSQGIVALTLLLVLTSAFFTGVIGIHPIFGAFMVGLICPHEGGFAIKVTEKLEDLVGAIFLPLYFALSGLSTNLGLLDTGMTWAYVVGVIAVAFCGKFWGATFAARLNGLVWRESFTIGSLMSCKGLVELIVLNIGLSAKILSVRTFTIFVVMALVTTFATTPLTSALYPPWYQKKLEAWKRGEIDWDTGAAISGSDSDSTNRQSITYEKLASQRISKLLVYLRLDNMPTIFAFMAILGHTPPTATPRVHPSHDTTDDITEENQRRPLQAHGVRLLELTDRESSVMQVTEVDEYASHDPIVNTFRTFGSLHNVSASGEVQVVPGSSFADVLVAKSSDLGSDLLLLPWTETGSISELQPVTNDSVNKKLETSAYRAFVSSALLSARSHVAVLISKNFGGKSARRIRPTLTRTYSTISQRSQEVTAPIADRSHHIFLPFFGGMDDQVALRLVLQMAENPDVTATLVHFETPGSYYDRTIQAESSVREESSKTGGMATEQAAPGERDSIFFASLGSSLPTSLASRVIFENVNTNAPVAAALERAKKELGQNPRNAGDLIVVGRNKAFASAFSREKREELGGLKAEAVSTLGVMAEASVTCGMTASVLVVRAGN